MKGTHVAALTVLGLVVAAIVSPPWALRGSAVETVFTFAAAGDIGWDEAGSNSKVMLQALQRDKANLSFFLALGDLSYSTTAGTEGKWCDYVKSYVGSQFPFQLLAGDHEDDDPVRIGNFTACLPDRLGSKGVYGKEYYFDVPAGAPVARFIQVSADLIFPPAAKWTYVANNSHFRWLLGAIDGARAAGIRWVIVSVHKPCIGLVGTACPSGQDLLDALLIKRVDLILHGDQHSYQRTKQLRCAIRSAGYYFPECIADSDGQFARGAGSVITIVGTGGRGLSPVDLTTDADRQYFAVGMGGNTAGLGWGYLRITISSTTLTAKTALSGTWQDAFSIGP
jgi:calcineurin-like phosphoesterase family protein